MPSLNVQEIKDFNDIKTQLKTLWNSCDIPSLESRFIPKRLDGKRVDLIPWLSSNFSKKTVDNLLQFQTLSNQITEKLLNSKNSETTKVKKLTVYRKMIAELLEETYEKNSYNLIPYALFAFSDSGVVSKTNRDYTKAVQAKNTGDNRIPIIKDILNQLIENAVNDLRKPIGSNKDYASKMLALELLTGRRQYEEILDSECFIEFSNDGFFRVLGLAKSSKTKKETAFNLPYLGLSYQNYDGEIAELLTSNLKLLRCFVKEKSELKTPLSVLLNTLIMQASLVHDNILKPVRKTSKLEMINGKTHIFRKLYAFSCYVFLDACKSNESQYFAEVLAEGTVDNSGYLKLNDITAKSYSIFRLTESL
ncbi:protelomerase family protein [Planktothrix sp.]|uniref:protelomerase family protein n=1 Tax=Planktothrix sp. TaxID=3088171 RepID=UPI0038D3DFAA